MTVRDRPSSDDFIRAPWTDDQVEALNKFQKSRKFHPFTCGNRHGHPYEEEYGDHGVLRATNSGWVCPFCDYTQNWAWDFMLKEQKQ